MSAGIAWLEDRLADVPAALADRVREAVRASEATQSVRAMNAASESVSGLLLDAAVACMTAALRHGPRRAAAADLLAADALLTWACEAAVDEGRGRLEALAVDASRMMAALPGAAE
jgi:hypothetical protein